MPEGGIRLGLRENLPQFALLVVVNAFVGAMVGLERSILPAIAEQDFHLAARAAILSFIVVFGVSKALTNYGAGRLADRFGRKHVLVAGWLVAIPVPLLLMWGPSWAWVVTANVFLGMSQGLTWSTTVIMKIDLVGPNRRGLAMGLNEFSGYVAVAGKRIGHRLDRGAVRPAAATVLPRHRVCRVRTPALGISGAGDEASCSTRDEPPARRDNGSTPLPARGVLAHDAQRSQSVQHQPGGAREQSQRRHGVGDLSAVFRRGGHEDRADRSAGSALPQRYGASCSLFTGAWSDRIGRKGLIVWGMCVQAAAIAVTASTSSFAMFAAGALLLGAGTAMVYPTLLAADW